MNSELRHSPNLPFLSMAGKPNCERRLNSCMIEFAQIALLQLAVDIVAVRTVAAVQIVLNAER